jgi:hypothetical protein
MQNFNVKMSATYSTYMQEWMVLMCTVERQYEGRTGFKVLRIVEALCIQ